MNLEDRDGLLRPFGWSGSGRVVGLPEMNKDFCTQIPAWSGVTFVK